MSKTLTIVVIALAVIMILILGFVFFLVLRDVLAPAEQPTVSTALPVTPTEGPLEPTATTLSQLPSPVITVIPTDTPIPTNTPTHTPLPTDTPAASATPLPTATATQRPVVIIPTNTPVPPTDTPVPAPPPVDTRGLVATNFGLQDRSVYAPNQQIWFEFTLVNTTGGEVPYNRLGVMPKKDGVDRPEWFQQSYGGPNASIKPQGLSHEDHIRLPESGNYTLRLAICFDGFEACNSGGGNWATLSPEIRFSLN